MLHQYKNKMINFKKINEISLEGAITELGDYRPAAFGIYLNLLNVFNCKELLLLESLAPGSIDSRVSLVGINPVLRMEVFDLIVTISGNEQILNKIRLIYEKENFLESSAFILRYRLPDRKAVWDYLRMFDDQFKKVDGGILAFTAFAYNTIHFIEDITGYVEGDIPDISLTCYSTYIEFTEDRVMLHEYGFVGAQSIGLSQIASCLALRDAIPPMFNNNAFSIDRETAKHDYLQKAEIALKHVRLGDVYQIQIGQKISVRSDVLALDVYARLRLMNPSPYMFLFDCGRFKVIGASPESFVFMNDDEVVMRPIAGTLGKSSVPTKDAATKEFRANSKEIAEHMMLVDLCRNDLCRISLPQSLNVSELMAVQEYSHVYHMVSTVKVLARQGCDKYDVIQASFPAGTMTGTPKIRAIELISAIEDSGRGLYAGAMGVIGLGANFINTALCIRTAIECDGVFTLRASAGMVSDSVVESEYAETLHKMGSVFKAITDEEISCHLR